MAEHVPLPLRGNQRRVFAIISSDGTVDIGPAPWEHVLLDIVPQDNRATLREYHANGTDTIRWTWHGDRWVSLD